MTDHKFSDRFLKRINLSVFVACLALLFVVVWQAPPLRLLQGVHVMPLWMHILMEAFSSTVAFMVFGVVWNAHSRDRSGNLLILAGALLAVGLIDLGHMLSFRGMPDFITPAAVEKGLNFWLVARMVMAAGLLWAALRPWRPFTCSHIRYSVLAASLLGTALVYWLVLFHPEVWPRTYVDGQGMTPFKIATEYVVIALTLVAVVSFSVRVRSKAASEARYLLLAGVVMILSELCFTLYSSVTDLLNLLGHGYKVIAFALLYRGVFVSSVRAPYLELAQSRSGYRSLVETMPDLVWEVDARQVCTYASPQVERILGYRAEELIGNRIFNFIPPAEETRTIPMLEGLATGQQRFSTLEHVGLRKDGSQISLESNVSALIGPQGRPTGYRGVSRDITERKQAERSLRKHSQAQSALLGISRELSVALDTQSVLQTTVDRIVQLTKLKSAAIYLCQGDALRLSAAAPSLPPGFPDGLRYASVDEHPHIRQALVTKLPVFLYDATTMDLTEAERLVIEQRNLRSVLYLPLQVGDKVSGVLIVASVGEPELLHADEIGMCRTLANLSALSLENARLYEDSRRHAVELEQQIAERKQNEQQIHQLAFYDTLTGLPNRRLLMDRLRQALASSARNAQGCALLFIDLDHFKTVNDTQGHDSGDALLRQVADRLNFCVREGDTVARLGGDEFGVVLEELSGNALAAAAQAETMGEKIANALNQPYFLLDRDHHGSASIGITVSCGQRLSADELLVQADIAMVQAKQAGRDMLRFFDPKMQESINSRVHLEVDLRQAIDRKELALHYQIQMDDMRRPLGAEALVRWCHPVRGMVSPGQFIPLAEDTGLILPIGQWVLETACAQLKTWQQDAVTAELSLAVNVSARQFRQPDFVMQVRETVRRHGINPARLKLELTEGMLLDNVEETIVTMQVLKKFGVQFSLDDFGTGYSSLQYLKRLPINQLKIDQSFVRDLPSDSGSQAIVRTILAMAQSLGLDVIAEGVETSEQQQLLQEKGCTHYQGYLFGRPMPMAQLAGQLRTECTGDTPVC